MASTDQIDLEAIAEQMAANRTESKAEPNRRTRIDAPAAARRRGLWWQCQALDWVDHVKPRTPPSEWHFVDKLTDFLNATGPNKKKDPEHISYSDIEKRAWRSFCAWHELVARELSTLVELLVDHDRWPCDSMLQQRLVDRGCEIKERYRSWLDTGRIPWIPSHWARKEKDGSRKPCTVVEYAAKALVDFEVAGDRHSKLEFESHIKGLRKQISDNAERYFRTSK